MLSATIQGKYVIAKGDDVYLLIHIGKDNLPTVVLIDGKECDLKQVINKNIPLGNWKDYAEAKTIKIQSTIRKEGNDFQVSYSLGNGKIWQQHTYQSNSSEELLYIEANFVLESER